MVCICGSSYCDCKGKCICDREFCNCSSCQKLWKKVCKYCGRECLCLELPESMNYNCKCSGISFEGVNFNKLPDLDFLSNKTECSSELGQSLIKNDSEVDSETSLDKSTSQTDELFFQTDGTDSSPDKNIEIRRLTELSTDSHSSCSSLPSILVSYCEDSSAMNEYASSFKHCSSGRVRHHSQSSTTSHPMSIESPSSQFSIESPFVSNRTASAPVFNTGHPSSSRDSPNVPMKSKSTSPRTGLSSTVYDTPAMIRDVDSSTPPNRYVVRTAHSTSSSPFTAYLSPERCISRSLKKLSLSDSRTTRNKSPERFSSDSASPAESKSSISSE